MERRGFTLEVSSRLSWAEALSASGSYGDPSICNRVISATRKVRNSEAAFERDGVAFPHMEYNFPLAFALLRAGAREARINVVDIGGAWAVLTSRAARSWVECFP